MVGDSGPGLTPRPFFLGSSPLCSPLFPPHDELLHRPRQRAPDSPSGSPTDVYMGPATGTGAKPLVVVPSPSAPRTLSPQQ